MADGSRLGFQRARSAEQKQQRRDSIREAARELALRESVRNVTLAMIAQRAGLAPSNVLANFGTREEIYFELLGEAWTSWTDSLEQALERLPPEPGKVAKTIANTLAAQPLYCDLVAYIGPSYEYGLSPEAARRAYAVCIENCTRFHAQLARLLSLTEHQVFDLRCAIEGFIAWWWMRSHPSANVAVGQEPTIDVNFEFAAGLERWIKTYIDGLLAERPPKQNPPGRTSDPVRHSARPG